MPEPFTPPSHKRTAFHCPTCRTYAAQYWASIYFPYGPSMNLMEGYETAFCSYCSGHSIWLDGKMIYPDVSTAPPPNDDMPASVRTDYLEASGILSKSPRGSVALLRLAIQRLCIELGEPGNNLNDDIASLVRKGLPRGVQQALDAVRVIGNEAVHPGQIDFSDTPEMAGALFSLVNFIVDRMISEAKAIDEIYGKLPPEKLAQIQKRDAKPE